MEEINRINSELAETAAKAQLLQIQRALLLNLTLYRLTEGGKVEPVSVRDISLRNTTRAND